MKNEGKNVKATPQKAYISTFALIMLNVVVIAGLANDPQQAFYGLSSVTYFAIGLIVMFIPTALVAAELASGWPQRGGIFRWVGEGIGKGWAFTCLIILWFQSTFNLGAGMPNFAATIMFFTPHYKKAIAFLNHPSHELLIMCGFLALFWFTTWLAARGTKTFSNISKYGVLIGTFIPLAAMIILTIVWLCQGNKPAIPMHAKDLIPQWNGIGTLALAAGVLFSYAGIDMNAAHIKELKHPDKQYPLSVLVAGILAFLIFVVGTLIIAMVVPAKQLNILDALYVMMHNLGSAIHAPWLYMILVYANFFVLVAMWITNLAGPSFMLGEAGQSGLLPKWLQNYNKHGMPSKMMYFQAFCVTIIAFMVKLLPNVEGFFVMITQTVTILYLLYYVVMFIAFIRLRYTQPNRPRSFKIPGGMFGAWLVTIVGIAACLFGIALALYPPTQVKKEVGSGTVYVVTIIALVAVVLLVALFLYQLSKRHNKTHHNDWVNANNKFAPLTWEIEGMKKPTRVTSNVPTEILSSDQNPMGMPIKHSFAPDTTINVPKNYEDHPDEYAKELRDTGKITLDPTDKEE
ncbi:MAG: APC family permease [Candidatus Paralactobacillus gallistercoris]|uniref:APC family permease n=1 Tax=Candidatus Paralactobacillus gallistercoris TaxID=2838724 RepID=A0A948X380_9LACO|nr:APC family permease [Candidatus Paralactobacillus gallistercoris]